MKIATKRTYIEIASADQNGKPFDILVIRVGHLVQLRMYSHDFDHESTVVLDVEQSAELQAGLSVADFEALIFRVHGEAGCPQDDRTAP